MALLPVQPVGAYYKRFGSGVSALSWGTQGAMGNSTYAGYIVKSARYTERNEKIDIENGTGFEAFIIMLLKGENVEFTVVDNSSVTAPTGGTVVTLDTAYGASRALLVEETSVSLAQKQAGERSITAKYYNACDVTANS